MSDKEDIPGIWKILVKTTNVPVLLSAILLTALGGIILSPVFVSQSSFNSPDIVRRSSIAIAASILLRFLMGYISDQFGRKWIIVGYSVTWVLLFPWYFFSKETSLLAFIVLFSTLVENGSRPVINAMIGDVAPSERRGFLYGLFASVQKGLISIVTVLVMIFAWSFVIPYALWIGFAILLCSSIILVFFLKETAGKQYRHSEQETIPEKHYVTNLLTVWKPLLGFFVFYLLFEAGIVFNFSRNYTLLTDSATTDVAKISLLVGLSWGLFYCAHPLGGWVSDRLKTRTRVIPIGIAVIIVFTGFAAFSDRFLWIAAFWCMAGVGEGFINPVITAYMVDLVPSHNLGASFGMLELLAGGARMIMLPVYWHVVVHFGGNWDVIITFVFLGLALMVMVLMRTNSQRRSGEQEQ